jgi:microfibrillar-associated protein 1
VPNRVVPNVAEKHTDRERENEKERDRERARRDRERERSRRDRERERKEERTRPIIAEVIAEQTVEEDEEEVSINEPMQLDEEAAREAREKLREKIAVPLVVATGVVDNEEEDEEAHDRRRARLRQLALQKQQSTELSEMPIEEEIVAEDKTKYVVPDTDQFEEVEEESEYESEEGEEVFPSRPVIAPVFKRKDERETLSDQQKLEEQQEILDREKDRRLQERRVETKEILKEEIKRNLEEQKKAEEEKEEEEEEEDDPATMKEEYEKWKLRELARIKKEREEKEKTEQERLEIERRRNLTDMEIMKEDKDKLAPKVKAQWNFLQKYYHKGAFFRTFDEKDQIADPQKWDFNKPTLEDKFDKSVLPKVMQVKNFGRSGRTKYTHLTDQDTTDWTNAWAQKDGSLDKYRSKMAGTGSVVGNKKRKL